MWHNIESYRENGLRVPAREGDTSRKEPMKSEKPRGSKPQACSRPQEENVAACESPQCVADRRHRAFGSGVGVRVYAASGENQPRPRHSGRPVGCPHCESTSGRCRFSEDMEKSRSIIESRVNALGASEASVSLQGNDQIPCRFPAFSDTEAALDTIGRTGKLGSSPASIVSPTKR